MCEMLNLWVPSGPTIRAPVRGLRFTEAGERHRGFAARFARGGTILAGHGDGPCLCGFDDWPALYELVRGYLRASGGAEVAFVKFWSGDHAATGEVTLDPEDPADCAPIPDGTIALARRVPPDRRRHRQVVRELARRVGQVVVVHHKDGRVTRGTLEAFDAESEAGLIDGTPLVAAQLAAVDPAPA